MTGNEYQELAMRTNDHMAAIEIDSKSGAENQLSHSENGISRTFSDCLMAYKGVVGFANCV